MFISLCFLFNHSSLITFDTPPPSPRPCPSGPRDRPQTPRRRRWHSRCERLLSRPLSGRPPATVGRLAINSLRVPGRIGPRPCHGGGATTCGRILLGVVRRGTDGFRQACRLVVKILGLDPGGAHHRQVALLTGLYKSPTDYTKPQQTIQRRKKTIHTKTPKY